MTFWSNPFEVSTQSTPPHDSLKSAPNHQLLKGNLNGKWTAIFFPQALLGGFSKLHLRAKGKEKVGTLCPAGDFGEWGASVARARFSGKLLS